MIEISRALLRRFREVLRYSLMESCPREPWPAVVCRAGDGFLSLEACHGDMAVRYRQAADHPLQVLSFPGALLAELEGRGDIPVVLEVDQAGKGQARWSDGVVPRVVEFDAAASEPVAAFAAMPKDHVELPEEFLTALGEAARSTARESARYALARVLLRGKAGKIVATDGRQLLMQGDFRFPWDEDVLVPRLPVFGRRGLSFPGPVRIGRTKEAVLLETGPWTFRLRIDRESRFPQVDQVIPRPSATTSRLHLDPGDASLLESTLAKLPDRSDEPVEVTLDLSRPPALRAQVDEKSPPIEVVLEYSTATGKPVRLRTSRRHLLRALQLGFVDILVVNPEKPLVCRDASTVFVWMPLDPRSAVPAGTTSSQVDINPERVSLPERRVPEMPTPSNGHADTPGKSESQSDVVVDLITEADALRRLLQEASARAGRLVVALRQDRRQSRAVQAAVETIRQLRLSH